MGIKLQACKARLALGKLRRALYTGYDKEELLSDDNLLESFFGSAEAGKDLLEFKTFDTVE